MTTLVIDASNMGHRARYSYSLSYKGKDTSVTYGVLRMIMAAIREVRPDSVIMCFDGGSPGFRSRSTPTYKSNRKHDEDPTYLEFIRQMDELQRLLPYFGIMAVRRAGIEADDLMYHASRMLNSSVILTNDDDLLQAVNDKTSVMRSTKSKSDVINERNFEQATGFQQAVFLMAKAVIGDSSDNVPGVKGIGPMLAQKMFSKGWPDVTVLPGSLIDRARRFMANDLERTLMTIDLQHDLTGARYTLVNTPWMPYNNKQVYRYCIDNAFQSLIEAGSLGATFGALGKPEFNITGMRMPYIWDYQRFPMQEE